MSASLHKPSPLLGNLLLFGRLLRSLGLKTSSAQLADVVQSLQHIDVASREDFKHVTKCNLVSRYEEIALFDLAFDEFWREKAAWGEVLGPGPPLEAMSDELQVEPRGYGQIIEKGQRTKGVSGRNPTTSDALDELLTPPLSPVYSRSEALRTKDFALLSSEELQDAKRFLETMQWSIGRRRARRIVSSKHGSLLDIRASFRNNLRYGGDLLHLARRRSKLRPRQLVVLCDVSGSMERYSRLLLHFVHSLGLKRESTEVFLFGTRLSRITRALRGRDADAAIGRAAEQVKDWAGGTRIGDCLRDFNHTWARRVLGNGAIVLIISDGWDRGNTVELSTEMRRLQRASFRLIWLNPLLGSKQYRPVTQGIRAALPYVDDFLPVHNLRSLEELALLLNTLPNQRPQRQQRKTHNDSKAG